MKKARVAVVALGTGHHVGTLKKLSRILGIPLSVVGTTPRGGN